MVSVSNVTTVLPEADVPPSVQDGRNMEHRIGTELPSPVGETPSRSSKPSSYW